MTQESNIGRFVFKHYIQPSREKRQRKLTLAARDVYATMGLRDDTHSVCSVLESGEFAKQYNVRLARRTPTKEFSTSFTFDLNWTEEEVREFTKKPLLAILATTYPSGAPQAVPVWYHYDGTHFQVTTSSHLPKIRNILRDPRVTLVIVDTSYHNYDKLVVRGRAEVTTDCAPEITVLHVERYLAPEETSEAIKRYNDQPNRVVIKIKPEKYL